MIKIVKRYGFNKELNRFLKYSKNGTDAFIKYPETKKNNGMWNAVRRSVKTTYPEGRAVRENTMPLTSLQPAPDYLQVAAASRAHVERVENGEDLPGALQRAITVIREERRQALLDVRVAVSDRH